MCMLCGWGYLARQVLTRHAPGPRLPLQMVNIGLRVLTRPIPSRLPEIYRTLGTDYAGGFVDGEGGRRGAGCVE